MPSELGKETTYPGAAPDEIGIAPGFHISRLWRC